MFWIPANSPRFDAVDRMVVTASFELRFSMIRILPAICWKIQWKSVSWIFSNLLDSMRSGVRKVRANVGRFAWNSPIRSFTRHPKFRSGSAGIRRLPDGRRYRLFHWLVVSPNSDQWFRSLRAGCKKAQNVTWRGWDCRGPVFVTLITVYLITKPDVLLLSSGFAVANKYKST